MFNYIYQTKKGTGTTFVKNIISLILKAQVPDVLLKVRHF